MIKLDVKIIINNNQETRLVYTASPGALSRMIDDFLYKYPNHSTPNGLINEAFADYLLGKGYGDAKSENVIVDNNQLSASITLGAIQS